jgi:hypothetical protein
MLNPDHFKKIFPAVIAAVILIASCSRGEGPGSGGGGGNGGPHVITDQDSIAPVVTINTPTEGQVFSSGTSVSMTGRVTDETGLYQGTVKLVNNATGNEVKSQEYQIHGFSSYDYIVTYAPTITTPTDFTVVVSFMDHGLNSTSRSVKIKINP